MPELCWVITQIDIPFNETISLPQWDSGLTGLLYLRSGSVLLAGDPGLPDPIGPEEGVLYPVRLPYRLTAREDASVILCAFPWEQEALAFPCRLERRQANLETLARIMEWGGVPLLAAAPPDCLPEHVPAYVRSACRIIQECYDEELTLEELSARVGRSKYHLSRAFRACCHVTPGAYLTSIRLSRAEQLLAETALPVREIGQRVGLPNSAYFTTLFRRHFGCSPTEYRALYQGAGAKKAAGAARAPVPAEEKKTK